MLLNCGVGEDSWESVELQGDPSSPSKGNQSWIFIGRTDAAAETLVLWPPDVKNWFIWKDPDAVKVWRQEDKGATEEEMVGWHHRLNGHEFEQIPGVGDGQGSHACYSPWGCKESDMTEWLNWLSDWLYYLFMMWQSFPSRVPILQNPGHTHTQIYSHFFPLLIFILVFHSLRGTNNRSNLVLTEADSFQVMSYTYCGNCLLIFLQWVS